MKKLLSLLKNGKLKMPRKSKSLEDFLAEASKKHNNTYDYSLINYLNSSTNIKIICKIHGVFEQRPDVHLAGRGCRSCGIKRHTDERFKDKPNNFLIKSKEKHGDLYDYSKVEYSGRDSEVTIICKEHGEFLQTPAAHMNGCGCQKCGIENARIKKAFTTDILIEKFKNIHGDRYDYSKVKYEAHCKKVIIICNDHGEFLQKPELHLRGRNCKSCATEIIRQKAILPQDVALAKLKKIYGNTFIYDKFIWSGVCGSSILTCKTHGDFNVSGERVFYGTRCPKCKRSCIESKIGDWLDLNNIKYIEQFSDNSCKSKYKLRFDFMLPEFKIIIEYDGEQHFYPVKQFGGEDAYNELIIKDQIKDQWAKNNGYKLFRISYINKKYIDKILRNYLEKNKNGKNKDNS